MNTDRVAFLVVSTIFFGMVALKPLVVYRWLSLGKPNLGGQAHSRYYCDGLISLFVGRFLALTP